MSDLTDNLRFLSTKKDGGLNVSRCPSRTLVEAADALESQEALIADLTESLVWAMRRHAEPKLVRGQNEDYYNAWRKASLTLSKAPSIK